MLRPIIQRALATTRRALLALLALGSACREGGEPDVPATVAPYFPVTAHEQVEASFDAAIASGDEPRDDTPAAESMPGATAAASDLPCAVASLLRARCARCHGTPPLAGVPISLTSYADLTAPAKTQPGVNNAQRALVRVQMRTMPPGGSLSSTEVDLLARWVEGGARPERCDAGSPAPIADDGESRPADAANPNASALAAGARAADAGETRALDADAADANPKDARSDVSTIGDATDEASASSACTSQSRWLGGDAGSALMNPGTACLGCHGARPPIFTFAGSIYASAHEPDQCNGIAANDAVVLIKAANGYKLALTVNAAGNFFTQTTLPAPFTVEVRYEGRTRTKQQPQTSGDCNRCHSELGSGGASGRLTLP